MANDSKKFFGIEILDFKKFFKENEIQLINQLYENKLLDDKKLKNPDTKKLILFHLLKNTIEFVSNSTEKAIFLISPEIISLESEILKYIDYKKLKKVFLLLFKGLKKNKYDFFILLSKSISEYDEKNILNDSEIKSFLDVNCSKSGKKSRLKTEKIKSLFNKIAPLIK